MAEWFETFFDGLYAKVLPDAHSGQHAVAQARIVKRLLRARKGQRVLDVPCGNGRLTIPLAQMGLSMTGVDLSVPYLALGRARAEAEGVGVRFACCDMRALPFEGAFDAAFNWGGSFGYFSDAGNARFCECLFRAVRPGGRVLIETVHRASLLAAFQPRSELVLCGARVRQDHRFDESTERLLSTWTYTTADETRQHDLSMRLYTTAQLADLLRSVGFRDVELHGGPPPIGPLGPQSRRAIAVATRPLPSG